MPPEMMTEENEMMKGFLRIFQEFVKAIKSYGDCDQYADKIEKWDMKKLFTCWITVAEPMKNGFQVLAHGDSWLNNMMFKGEDDILYLDFQACSWASPALDLHYFITSSVHDDIKIDKYDEIMKFYYDELIDSLTKLNYDGTIPSYEEFEEDLIEKSSQGDINNFNKFLKLIEHFFLYSNNIAHVYYVCDKVRIK